MRHAHGLVALGLLAAGCTEPELELELTGSEVEPSRTPSYSTLPARTPGPPVAEYYARTLSRDTKRSEDFDLLEDVPGFLASTAWLTTCDAVPPSFPAVSEDGSVVVLALASGTWEEADVRLRFIRTQDGSWLGDRTIAYAWENTTSPDLDRLALRWCARARAAERLLEPGAFDVLPVTGAWADADLPAGSSTQHRWIECISDAASRRGHDDSDRLGQDIVLAHGSLSQESLNVTPTPPTDCVEGGPRFGSRVYGKGALQVFVRYACGC